MRVPVPDFYKGQGDSRNLQEVIIRVTDNGLYRLGTSQRTSWMHDPVVTSRSNKRDEAVIDSKTDSTPRLPYIDP